MIAAETSVTSLFGTDSLGAFRGPPRNPRLGRSPAAGDGGRSCIENCGVEEGQGIININSSPGRAGRKILNHLPDRRLLFKKAPVRTTQAPRRGPRITRQRNREIQKDREVVAAPRIVVEAGPDEVLNMRSGTEGHIYTGGSAAEVRIVRGRTSIKAAQRKIR
jgi:hypothetical protein